MIKIVYTNLRIPHVVRSVLNGPEQVTNQILNHLVETGQPLNVQTNLFWQERHDQTVRGNEL